MVQEMPKVGRPKGTPKTGGRTKGTPNKATKDAKEMIVKIVDATLPEIVDWIRQSAYGVGRAYAEWTPPEDWNPKRPDHAAPRGSKVFGKGGPIMAPVLDDDGQHPLVSLLDLPNLPVGAHIDWIVRPNPGDNPDKVLRALEYHIPKINRTEHTGADGSELQPMTLVVKGVKAPPRKE